MPLNRDSKNEIASDQRYAAYEADCVIGKLQYDNSLQHWYLDVAPNAELAGKRIAIMARSPELADQPEDRSNFP
ncbi:MAG TPA: hypothetical protein DDW52_10620 [Planctomycetaceae bacterium]|nr:hypothetical protein [Planctomycetaceae bacterium]